MVGEDHHLGNRRIATVHPAAMPGWGLLYPISPKALFQNRLSGMKPISCTWGEAKH